MPLSVFRICWFFLSILVSGYVGLCAYDKPLGFISITDLLATILSILIGISLAISAVLSTRPSINSSHYNDEQEKQRIEKIIKSDDISLIEGQTLVFWCYYIALLLAVILKLIGSFCEITGEELYIKVTSSTFAFFASLALLWSATLPDLLKKINIQRKNLESLD